MRINFTFPFFSLRKKNSQALLLLLDLPGGHFPDGGKRERRRKTAPTVFSLFFLEAVDPLRVSLSLRDFDRVFPFPLAESGAGRKKEEWDFSLLATPEMRLCQPGFSERKTVLQFLSFSFAAMLPGPKSPKSG